MTSDDETESRLWPASLSLADACAEAVCRIVDLFPSTQNDRAVAREVLSILCSEFPDGAIGHARPTGLACGFDGSPMQLSIRVGRSAPEVRWNVDIAPGIPRDTADANLRRWQAGVRIAERLEKRFDADLTIFHELVRVLSPDGASGNLEFSSRVPIKTVPQFQTYFFLEHPDRPALVEVADVLGIRAFVDRLLGIARDDDFVWAAVDLSRSAESRAKIYVTLGSFDLAHLESYRALAGEAWPVEDPQKCFEEIYGEVPGPNGPGPVVGFQLRAGKITGVALDLPASPFQLDLRNERILDDGEIAKNLCVALRRRSIPPDPYVATLEALRVTNLEDEIGMHERVAFLRDDAGFAATAYLSPRFFAHRFGFKS